MEEDSSEQVQDKLDDNIDDDENQDQDQEFDNANKLNVVVPRKEKSLKCCVRCHLIKSQDQWEDQGRCENCPEFEEILKDGIVSLDLLITQQFEGIQSIINPLQSWVAKKLKIIAPNLVPGAYALKLKQDIHDKVQQEFEVRNIKFFVN